MVILLVLATLSCATHAQGVVATITPNPVQAGVFRLAVNAVTNRTYVVNSGGSVTVIDGQTDATTIVPCGKQPSNVAVNPNTNKIYVTDGLDTVVTVIDGATNTTTPVAVGGGTDGIALNPLTNKIYALSNSQESVTVIDGATNATVSINTAAQSMTGVVVNPATNRIYVNDGAEIIVIDGETNKILTSVQVGTVSNFVTVNPVTNTLYATNGGSNDVSVIDGATNTLTATVPVGKTPSQIAINVTTNKIYVANTGDNTVTVMDGASNTTATVPVDQVPGAIGVDAQRNLVFVANTGFLTPGKTVTLIDGGTNAATSIAVGSSPIALGVNSVTGKVYVANNGQGSVSVIDSATYATNNPVVTGTNPVAVAVNPATNKAYVANKGSASVTVIDATTSATATVAVGTSPTAIVANPVTNRIYVANNDSANVTVIDGATNATSTIAAGANPGGVAINLVTNRIYVTNAGSDNVTVIDGATRATATVAVGSKPAGVAVNPVSNKIYVANSGGETVTVIDGTTNKVIATVTVGQNPVAIDINPNTNTVYVANSTSNIVSIVDGATDTPTNSFVLAGGSLAVAVDAAANHVYAIGNSTSLVDYDVAHNAAWTVPIQVAPIALAVNSGSHRVYIAGKGYPQVLVLDGASQGLRSADLGAGNFPTALAVNAVTGQVFAALSVTNLAATIREQRTSPVSLTASIAPIPGNASAIPIPTFVISASGGSPAAPPPRAAYVQADSWQGPWTAATATGTSGQFSSKALVLRPGYHTIYAYATDGQDATSVVSGSESNVFASNIVSYSLLVLQSNSPFGALSSQALTFRSLPLSITSDPQTVTLSNGGGAPLALSGVSVTGSNAGDFSESNACPATLAVGANCTVSVTFTPSVSGPRSASIVVASDSAGGPVSIALGGSGIGLSLAAAASSSLTQTIQAGQTATYSLQLTAAGAANVTDQVSATISCAGAPALATCNAPAAAVIATGETPGTFQISVSTTGAMHSASVVPTFRPPWDSANGLSAPKSPVTWLGRLGMAGLMCTCLARLGRGRRIQKNQLIGWTSRFAWVFSARARRPCARNRGPCTRSPLPGMHVGWIRAALCTYMLLLPLFGAALLTGCSSGVPASDGGTGDGGGNGNGGGTPPPTGQSTPPGTYTLTVSATVSGVAQTAHLTLVVQ